MDVALFKRRFLPKMSIDVSLSNFYSCSVDLRKDKQVLSAVSEQQTNVTIGKIVYRLSNIQNTC